MLRATVLVALAASVAAAQTYDLVIVNGHVMDPDSGLDAARNIGITAGKIRAISSQPLNGKQKIDAHGLVVAPGFIDIHSHGQTDENYRYKARDGVTTALEMEVGAWPVDAWYRAREGKALINFGATSGHLPAAMAVMHDTGGLLPRDNAVNRAPTEAEIRQTFADIRQGLDQGGLGIGMGIAYVPKTSREEILDIFRIAAERHATIHVHMRNPGAIEPGVVDSLQEVIGDAAATGASVHVVHITSMAIRETPLALAMIDGAKKRGIDITTECYPYTAGMTDLSSAIFATDWRERLSMTYHDLQWTATGERLTAETFAKYRKKGGMVVQHFIPEEMVKMAVAHPGVIIASDGDMTNGTGHPRGAGTYARVLGVYVRQERALPLMEGLRKMTILPAQRVGLVNKGRIRVGADADITVFDPAHVIDRATYEKPAQYSDGIPYVVVNGVVVVNNSQLATGVFPGRGVKR